VKGGHQRKNKSVTSSQQQQSKLFRDEVFEAKRDTWLGQVALIRPISFTFLTVAVVALAATVLGFLFWGVESLRELTHLHRKFAQWSLMKYERRFIYEKRPKNRPFLWVKFGREMDCTPRARHAGY
jgi:hypothetical protein